MPRRKGHFGRKVLPDPKYKSIHRKTFYLTDWNLCDCIHLIKSMD